MIHIRDFSYKPGDHEAEKASNSYVMSVVAVACGLPLPIINLFATFFFFVANRKGTFFVRWHCTQALLSQFSLLLMNSYGFWWTVSLVFGDAMISNTYIAYILTILLFNIIELISTIYTAIKARKGIHVEWWFYGLLTNLICKS